METELIQPQDGANVIYWAKKMGVSRKELFDAILNTGSLDPRKVKEFLKRDSWLYHPVDYTARIIRTTIDAIF